MEVKKKVESINTKYGNSNFGHWLEDEFKLPAFQYACDQFKEERGRWEFPVFDASTTSLNLKESRVHWHQVGNDRLVAIATNEGYVQLFSMEGGAKWLNYYQPKAKKYAGGFGYLKTKGKCINSLYSDKSDDVEWERVFGMGYYKKHLTDKKAKIEMEQVVFAPFGQDSVLVSQVKIKNNSSEEIDLNYYEYWEDNLYQIIFPREEKERLSLEKKRLSFGENFKLTTRFEKSINTLFSQKFLKKEIKKPEPQVPTYEDYNPPIVFLTSLSIPAKSFETDPRIFFGQGNKSCPDILEEETCCNSTISLEDNLSSCSLVMQIDLKLAPHSERTVYFIYGYAKTEDEIKEMVKKYSSFTGDCLENSMQAWRDTSPVFESPKDKWLKREIIWHYYYLRSGFTFDDFFKNFIVSQGCAYQYTMGFNGAVRDPLQHALPLIYLEPELCRETLRFCLKLAKENGETPYSIVGRGIQALVVKWMVPSDNDIWLLWLASEYILQTQDFEFLEEKLPYYESDLKETVYQHLVKSYQYLINNVGLGENKLLKARGCDWNDAILIEIPQEQRELFVKKGESVLNSAMASYILPLFAEVVKSKGDKILAEEIEQVSQKIKDAVKAQWNGKWFNRALWNSNIIGKEKLFLEPQPWTIIANIADPGQAQVLIDNIHTHLRKDSPIGAVMTSSVLPPSKKMSALLETPPGEVTNRGVWYALNIPLAWSLSLYDTQMGWDELIKNTLAQHAEVYPDIWMGVWSGPDSYNSWVSSRAGQTWQPLMQIFPIMCMHAHAQILYGLIRFCGLEVKGKEFVIDPKFPFENFSLSLNYFSLSYDNELIKGFFRMASKGDITLKVKLPQSWEDRNIEVKVGTQKVYVEREKGFVKFDLSFTKEEKIPWEIKEKNF